MRTVAILLLIGCQRMPAGAQLAEALLDNRQQRITHLAQSCEPADLAQLVLMAGGSFAWDDAFDDRDERIEMQTRNWAMGPLAELGGFVNGLDNRVVEDRFTAQLEVPLVRTTLLAMLDDERMIRPGRSPRRPRDAAEFITEEVRVPSLESEFRARDLSRSLDRLSKRGPMTGWFGDQIDHVAAKATPQAFRELIAMLEPTYVWPNNRQPPPADLVEIRERVAANVFWFTVLPPARRCGAAIRAQIAEGDLGAAIVEHLRGPESPITGHLIYVLTNTPRSDSRTALEAMRRSPDHARLSGMLDAALAALDRFEQR